MVDSANLVTLEDITDPGGEDVVVLGEGDALSDDDDLGRSDAAEYYALGDGALPRSLTTLAMAKLPRMMAMSL